MISTLLLAAATVAEAVPDEPPPLETVSRETVRWLMGPGDIAQLQVHRDANRELLATPDPRAGIVLMGDSLTFHWPPEALPVLPGARIVNRGIPGQVTGQMLLRFEEDVVALKPAAVVILAGTNDLRGSAGAGAAELQPALHRLASNLTAMADIADARGIRVIVCAIPPVDRTQATVARDPAAIAAANAWLRHFATEREYPFLDYHAALAGPDGLIEPGHTSDGLHLTREAYLKLREALLPALRAVVER